MKRTMSQVTIKLRGKAPRNIDFHEGETLAVFAHRIGNAEFPIHRLRYIDWRWCGVLLSNSCGHFELKHGQILTGSVPTQGSGPC